MDTEPPCTGMTKARKPCKGTASRWPEGVPGNPLLCGTHLPVNLRDIRDAGFAEQERRHAARLDSREPACWSWDPTLTEDRILAEYEGSGIEDAAEDLVRRIQNSDEAALRLAFAIWHDRRCAVCGMRAPRLVKDHDHETGIIRGLLCRHCNSAEPHDDGLFRGYRERPPAEILGIRLPYVDPIHGVAEVYRRRRQLDDHPAYVLAPKLSARLNPSTDPTED
jgi:hypothetical protein